MTSHSEYERNSGFYRIRRGLNKNPSNKRRNLNGVLYILPPLIIGFSLALGIYFLIKTYDEEPKVNLEPETIYEYRLDSRGLEEILKGSDRIKED